MAEPLNGWEWFENHSDNAEQPDDTTIAVSFARCFDGEHGLIVRRHLHSITTKRSLGPEASDAALRHLEGQRHLMAIIENILARGRSAGDANKGRP